MRARRTARIYLFDKLGRVLLIHFAVEQANGLFEFWLTPGGEIEADEHPAEAAERELREELALDVRVRGPIYTERNQFEHHGEMRDNTDYFFRAECAAEAPRLTGLTAEEIAVMRESRWWFADEIEQALVAGLRFFPSDIVSRTRAWAPGTPRG